MPHRSLQIAPVFMATVLLAACASNSTTPSLAPQSVAPAVHPVLASYMAPDAKQQTSLLYVSSVLNNDVYVYSYPKHKLVGTLTGFKTPYGLCTDSAGDVFVVNDAANDILEYAHGGTTAIATLSNPNEYSQGCSVDPTTGNLAVTNFYSSTGGGSISVYAKATGTPTIYSDPDIHEFRLCGYDDKGNLFADGVSSASAFEFAELPAGKTSLVTVPVDATFSWPGGVQYDGKYVAVADTYSGKLYRIDGKTGKVVTTLSLSDASGMNQFYIVPGKHEKLIGPLENSSAVNEYPYPSTKFSKKILQVSEPWGAAVSTI